MCILGAATLNPDKTVTYRCTTRTPSRRFTEFMKPLTSADSGTDAKTLINETLVAPRTVGHSADAHELVLNAFVAGLSSRRRKEIAAWVAGKFAPHTKGVNVQRVGIWVRNVTAAGGHTDDQNMSKVRFQKILDAAQRSGVDELILLGDGLPAPDWLSYATGGAHYALSPTGTQGAVHDFSRLWHDDTRLPSGSCSRAETLRGYAEQVCVYAALYRNPSATVHVNMRCIVTNKSGGPDLPSLAGIPQIQIAEMPGTEDIVFHRMGFQALCSHASRIYVRERAWPDGRCARRSAHR